MVFISSDSSGQVQSTVSLPCSAAPACGFSGSRYTYLQPRQDYSPIPVFCGNVHIGDLQWLFPSIPLIVSSLTALASDPQFPPRPIQLPFTHTGEVWIINNNVMSEPSFLRSMYEMPSSPSVSFAMQRSIQVSKHLRLEVTTSMVMMMRMLPLLLGTANCEVHHFPSALAPYCVADPGTSTMTEHVSGTEHKGLRAPRIDNKDDSACNRDRDTCGGRAVQRERGTTGPSSGGTTASHAQRASEAQAGSTWNNCGSMRGMQDAIPGQ